MPDRSVDPDCRLLIFGLDQSGKSFKAFETAQLPVNSETAHFWVQIAKALPRGSAFVKRTKKAYNVDSISNPQASSSASGIYLEFLLRRAHSRRRVDRIYWSGGSLNSFTICSKEVTVGTTGPMGSGLPQLGFPRRFAIDFVSLVSGLTCQHILRMQMGSPVSPEESTPFYSK